MKVRRYSGYVSVICFVLVSICFFFPLECLLLLKIVFLKGPQTSTPAKPLGQPSPSVVKSPAIIADSLLSTSELWSASPIRDLGGVDGESNKSAM